MIRDLRKYLTDFLRKAIIKAVETHCRSIEREAVTVKRRLPDIPRERNGGMCIALAGNSSQGGDIHNTSRDFLDYFYWLDCHPGVG